MAEKGLMVEVFSEPSPRDHAAYVADLIRGWAGWVDLDDVPLVVGECHVASGDNWNVLVYAASPQGNGNRFKPQLVPDAIGWAAVGEPHRRPNPGDYLNF